MNKAILNPVLITGAALGVLLLVAQGWLLPALVLAALTIGWASSFYGAEDAREAFSKEEDLARWGVKWELDNPGVVDGERSVSNSKTVSKAQQQPRGMA